MSEVAKVIPFKAESAKESPQPVEGLKLHLGCNQHPVEGYINVDIESFDGVDVVADLEKTWPWESGSVAEIVTNDLPEHLRQWYEEPDPELLKEAESSLAAEDSDKLFAKDHFQMALRLVISAIRKPKRTYGIFHFMNEAHRVLTPGGLLKAQIPTTDHRAWAQDPTHVSYWNENTMLYFLDPQYRAFYPQHVKGEWKKLWLGSSIANPRGESWMKVVLEKVA